jgi:hypothetical protein
VIIGRRVVSIRLLIGGGRIVDAMWVKLLVLREFDCVFEVVDG